MLAVTRKEVIIVPAEMLMKNEPTALQPPPTAPAEDELRRWARKHVEHVRKLKRDVAVFGLAMVVLTAIWALIEWQDNGGFERFSNDGNPGDWEPWILYVALVWGFFLAIDALKTHFDRPATEAEIDPEVRRLRADG